MDGADTASAVDTDTGAADMDTAHVVLPDVQAMVVEWLADTPVE
jgi:hypothetical protein